MRTRAPQPRSGQSAQEDQFARLAHHYDTIMSNVPYQWWAEYVCTLAALAGRTIVPGEKLLDLATGTGSVAIEFARLGCEIVGVDLSAPMIAQAKEKARSLGISAEFLCQDLADLDLPQQFDHAVCLYDSLNYIVDPDRLKQAFARIKWALKDDGIFIFDVNTIYALEAELFTQESRPGAAIAYHWESKYDREARTSTIRMRFEVMATGEAFTITHQQRGYTDAELRSYLFHGGFADVTSYDGYRLMSPGPQSDRIFYVAKATA